MHTITRRCYNVAVIIAIRPPTLHIVFGEKREEEEEGGIKRKIGREKKSRSGRDTAAAITAASTVSAGEIPMPFRRC